MMSKTEPINKQGTDISQFFNLILENFKLASIFILDKEGTILNINTGVQKSLGYSHEDLIGKNFSVIFREEDRKNKMPENEIATVLKRGYDADNNYILHKNGKEIWVHGESAFTKDDEGKIFIIKLVYDLNDVKLLENSLKEKNAELDKINKDLDTFVYAASHDLKAPIYNIEALINNLYSELNEETKKKKEISEIVQLINISIDKFKKTINDLSVIGKIGNGTNSDISQISFNEILEDVKFNLKELIKDSNPLLIEDFSQAPVINISKKILRSVVQNLLSNAMKFRSPARRLEIKITTEKFDNKYILLQVEDNGLGMSKKDKDTIFSMYKRLHNDIEGTGVGMGIVKRMLDSIGGKIEVRSEVGRGSVFCVYFKAV
jgi:PAS domain S-box-containing protein